MPVIVLAIPAAAEIIGVGLVALRAAMLANRARAAYQAAQAARVAAQAAQVARAAQMAEEAARAQAHAKEKEKEKSEAKTDTTTVVGKKKLDCGEDGSYGDLKKRTGENKFDRDHIPSKAALQQAARDLIRKARLQVGEAAEAILFGDNGTISNSGQTIITPKPDHKDHSRTYGNRNKPAQISADAKDLQKAAEKDTKAMEDALDDEDTQKEMDPECIEKYKKAAEKIRQKTHAEYMNDLKKLIKDAIEKAKKVKK